MGSRFEKYPFFKRYKGERATEAAEAYVNLARKYAIEPAQMAIAYTTTRAFVASALVSVSNVVQLNSNADGVCPCPTN